MNKLAIVIPYYKIDFFEETLKSLANQTNLNFSLYIGNDQSQRDPLPLIKKNIGNINYQYYLYNSNVGRKNLALQWERILKNVSEEWFQILGDDDAIAPNFVEEFYRHLQIVVEKDIKVIRFDYEKIDESGNVLQVFHQEYNQVSAIDFMQRKLNWEEGSSLSENIFRMDQFKKYGFEKFPLAWHSDDYAILRLSDFGDLYHINSSFVLVRTSSISITGSTGFSQEKLLAKKLFYEAMLNNKMFMKDHAFVEELKYGYLYSCRNNLSLPKKNIIGVLFKPFSLRMFLCYIKTFLIALLKAALPKK